VILLEEVEWDDDLDLGIEGHQCCCRCGDERCDHCGNPDLRGIREETRPNG
jgi:hypothetical protein